LFLETALSLLLVCLLLVGLLLVGLPCLLIFVIAMLGIGVSKRKLSLMLGIPAAAILLLALVLLLVLDNHSGEAPPAWLALASFVAYCFGPPLALLGLVALYQKLRSRHRGNESRMR